MTRISQYGYSPAHYPIHDSFEPARITSVHKGRYGIISDHGEAFAQLKTSSYYEALQPYPTVGDFVAIIFNPFGDSLIVETLPRRSYFARRDPTPGHGEQAVASNFNHVFIMQSMNADFSIPRLERYLALALQSGAKPTIILTKADLADDPAFYIDAAASIASGITVLPVSTYTRKGLDTLAAMLLPGETVVFLGSSGVGKSTLVNALAGEEIMQVHAIREDDAKGRHTTTHRQLLMLPSGVMVIDTPGMRELGMWDASEGLSAAFTDVEAFLGHCRFSDCTHTHEPGCAVRAAIESGKLSAERWASYRKLTLESDASVRAAQLIEKQKKMKAISKFNHRARKMRDW